MSLLQIHDPAAAARPIGIDLGTTNSLVAYVTPTGEPVVIQDCDNVSLVPSVVHYPEVGPPIVGVRAKELAAAFPLDTIASVKRFMGRGASDPETRALGAYRFATAEGPVVKFAVAANKTVTPVDVSAEILQELKDRAEDELGAVGGAVITVPAYFDDAQRQATKDAAKLAGLEVLRLLNEPTAAALAYGLDKKVNGRFAVYDLGGGTFDITILDLDDGVFQVRATGGDSQLGGDDIDRRIGAFLLEKLGIESPDPSSVRFALDAGRELKHSLTDHEVVETEIEHSGKRASIRMDRSELAALAEPLLARTASACRRALRDAETAPSELDGVILVGGSTRSPVVRDFAAALFERAPLTDIDPELVVALGAAQQADLLAGSDPREDVLLLDVLPLSLGIEAMGGVVERILPRNTAIPCEAAQVFTTYAEQQTGFEIHVVQGERELADDCRSLARFTLKGIPPMAAGLPRLEVRFRVDADGLLSVSAVERTTGIEQQVDVKPSYGLDDDAIEKMLLEAYEHGEGDIELRSLREQRVEAERVLSSLEKAMAEDASLLLGGERERIEAAAQELRAARDGENHRRIAAKIEALDEVSHEFAGRRMDHAIKRALAGRAVEGIESETAHARGIDAHMSPELRDESE